MTFETGSGGLSGHTLTGPSLLRAAKRLFFATRPGFFPASVVPVLLGTAWGHRGPAGLDTQTFLLALAAVLCAHAAANVLNDVFDEIGGSDRANTEYIHPYTGGSRFIQAGIMSVPQMTRWGAVLLVAGACFGFALFLLKGPGVILFGLAGAGLGVLYSAPPAQLSARGLGEAAIALGFGVVPVAGAVWLQSGILDGDALLLSLPLSLWVAGIILINEVPDVSADAASGKRTFVVRFGLRKTKRLYLALHALALFSVVALVWKGLLPALGAAVPALLAFVAIRAANGITAAPEKRSDLRQAIRLTLAIHAVGGLWLTGWVWLA